MIAVDASAVLAILFDEPEAKPFRKILTEQGGVISPVNHWEVLVRARVKLGATGPAEAEALIESLMITVAPATADDSRNAASAFERFGKRSAGHLNLGDCFAYALAGREGDGLLFKGDDFPRTDIKAAI